MKRVFASALLLSACLLHHPTTAQAQTTAPNFPSPLGPTAARPADKLPTDAARARRQAQMSPAEATRDQQMQVMEARTGNTSFGLENGNTYRPQSNANGAFTVRKYQAMRGQEQKKGTTKRVQLGGRTTGEPLKHKHKTKHKLLFF